MIRIYAASLVTIKTQRSINTQPLVLPSSPLEYVIFLRYIL